MVGPQLSAVPWFDSGGWARMSDSTSTQMTPSSHLLGSCGHELDEWETHLEHSPDCPRELCLEDRCDCPEVCPECCRACGHDTAERMGS